MPVSTSARNGHVRPTEVTRTLDCPTKKANCGSYTTHGTWSGLRSLMTWSINRDRYWELQKTFDGGFD
ncbi:hypothetical protein GCM10022206_01290 [Streptomyces chiangmaiensis]